MKLRIKDNSLRLRLTQTEVNQIARGETVQARIAFGLADNALTYTLASQEVPEIVVIYQNHTISVSLPKKVARAWAMGDTVGIEKLLPLADDQLRVLIEKDFQCLHQRPHEDESDHFANPDATPAQ